MVTPVTVSTALLAGINSLQPSLMTQADKIAYAENKAKEFKSAIKEGETAKLILQLMEHAQTDPNLVAENKKVWVINIFNLILNKIFDETEEVAKTTCEVLRKAANSMVDTFKASYKEVKEAASNTSGFTAQELEDIVNEQYNLFADGIQVHDIAPFLLSVIKIVKRTPNMTVNATRELEKTIALRVLDKVFENNPGSIVCIVLKELIPPTLYTLNLTYNGIAHLKSLGAAAKKKCSCCAVL